MFSYCTALTLLAAVAICVHFCLLQNGEDQVSYFLFWQYLASLVTLPAFLALYLQLLQRGLLTVVAAS